MPESLPSQIHAPFDAIASRYDSEFDRSAVTPALRKVVWNLVESRIGPGSAILELNCGTGTDALHFASLGCVVTATDISERMLAMGREKERALMGEEPGTRIRATPVEWKRADAGRLAEARFPASSIDCVFSNFGGLNCVPPESLAQTFAEVGRILRPGGVAVLVLMGKFSIWESVAFLLRGRIRDAFRRSNVGPVQANLGPTSVQTWYYTLSECAAMVRPWAGTTEFQGLSVLSPPPDSRSFISRFPRLTSFLLGADDALRSFPVLRGIGDHFILIAERAR